jgi:hypothetical protein
MTKKRMALLAVLPLTIAVILGLLAMMPPRPGVTKANFDRIRVGMTLAEVEAILGQSDLGEWGRLWLASDGSYALIEFWDDGVISKRWFDSNETILDKIRRWLHLR